MAPRKIGNTKKGRPKKTTEPPQPEVPSVASARDGIRPFIPSNEGLEHMMGFDAEDSSDLSDDATYQSQPNFSFLPSHKHSSPRNSKKKNIPAVHRLASMSTVPNSDLAQPNTSNEPSTGSRHVSSNSSPSVPKPSSTPPTNKKAEAKKQNRKQKTPTKLKALREIVRLQGTVTTLIPKLSFGRVIREILADYSNSNLRVTVDMLQCLQEAAEIYIVQLFEDAYKCTVHRGRITLIPKDMHLTLMIRRES